MILLSTLTVYDVARNGFQILIYASNRYELIMWRKVNESNAGLPLLKYDISCSGIEYGLRIRYMDSPIEREIGELKGME
jgi:hypothetical protein